MPKTNDTPADAISRPSRRGSMTPARGIGLAMCALFLAASCVESAPAGPVLPLIPADAALAVVVDSPYALYSAACELWTAAGLDDTLGSSPDGLIERGLPLPAEELELLDFARPWAFALLPASPGSSVTRSVLYIPLRGRSDEPLGALGGDSLKLVAQAEGYAVFATGEGDLAFPPPKALDLSRLAGYPASSIKLWADPDAIRSLASDGFEPIADSARRFVTGEAEGPDAATKVLERAALSLLKELRCADAAVVVGSAGLSIRVGAVARPEGLLEKILTRAADVPSALDWASQVNSGALSGYAWSCDPELATELSSRFSEPLLVSLGLPADFAAGLKRLQGRWAAAAGKRGAASFDMDLDFSSLKNIDGQDPSGAARAIRKAISFDVEALQEVEDDARYRDLIRGMAGDPDIATLSAAYSDLIGMGFALENEDKRDGDFPYGELGLRLTAADPSKFGMGEGDAAAVLDAMGDLLRFRWTVSAGRMALSSGDAADLRSLVSRAAAPSPLSADPVFAAFARTLPPDVVMIGSVSLRRLFEMIGRAASEFSTPNAGLAASIDPSRFGSWYSYAAIGGEPGSSSLEVGLHIPASDLGALVGLGISLGAERKADADAAAKAWAETAEPQE